MSKQYQWRAALKYASTTTMSYGVSPNDKSNWQTADIGTGETSQTWTWWYRDSNTSYGGQFVDAISSRANVQITETWTTSVDNRNNLTVSVRVTIGPITRDDLRGSDQNTPGRNINIYREQGSATILSLTDNLIATAHTIYSGPLVLDQYSFTIAPGENLERSSLYLHNQTIGYPSYDDIWLGVQFRNILPADYRSGATFMSGDWYSHNRDGGACGILNGSGWSEMRTLDGGVGTDDPPYIKHSDAWKNQRLIGLGG